MIVLNLFTFVSLALAAVDVRLSMVGDSQVRATITNSGSSDIHVISAGSILSSAPVQKVHISNASKLIYSFNSSSANWMDGQLPFHGVKVYVDTSQTPRTELIRAKSSVNVEFDISQVYDLSLGGPFTIQSFGKLNHVDRDTIVQYEYTSNALTLDIDAATTARTPGLVSQNIKRASPAKDCTGDRLDAILAAKHTTKQMALYARNAARIGHDDKMMEYYKNNSQHTRDIVSDAFDKMYKLHSHRDIPEMHCSDVRGHCEDNVAAYTLQNQSSIVFCDFWFTLPQQKTKCRFVDQSFIALHEASHLYEVKGTNDYFTYGYQGVRGLPAEMNINHADTYAYFAHDLLAKC